MATIYDDLITLVNAAKVSNIDANKEDGTAKSGTAIEKELQAKILTAANSLLYNIALRSKGTPASIKINGKVETLSEADISIFSASPAFSPAVLGQNLKKQLSTGSGVTCTCFDNYKKNS